MANCTLNKKGQFLSEHMRSFSTVGGKFAVRLGTKLRFFIFVIKTVPKPVTFRWKFCLANLLGLKIIKLVGTIKSFFDRMMIKGTGDFALQKLMPSSRTTEWVPRNLTETEALKSSLQDCFVLSFCQLHFCGKIQILGNIAFEEQVISIKISKSREI